MKMIISGDHFAAKGKEMFKNKNSYSKTFFANFFLFRMFIIQKKHIPQQVSYYYFLRQNILKILLLRTDLLYNKLYHSISVKNAYWVKTFIVQTTYQHNYKPDYFLRQNTIKSWTRYKFFFEKYRIIRKVSVRIFSKVLWNFEIVTRRLFKIWKILYVSSCRL